MSKILIIEDDPAISLLLTEFLKAENFQSDVVEMGYEALDHIKRDCPDIVLVDLNLPDIDGMTLISEIFKISKYCEVIIVTGESAADTAMEATRLGARDYIVKPVTKERLLLTINNSLDRLELNKKVQTLEESKDEHNRFYDFIGSSNTMQGLYQLISSAAKTEDNIIVSGEQGTGKTLCAETIHQISDRADQPFLAVNCAFLEDEQAEKELLEKILATKAGTLYLENISELPLNIQARLLKHMEDTPSLRVICSTPNAPLEEVKEKKLREDLYYRLSILQIDMPPLRERGEDVNTLANYFLRDFAQKQEKTFGGFDHSTQQILKNYHWPGNIRELQNVMKNIVTMNAESETVTTSMFPKHLQNVQSDEVSDQQGQDNVVSFPVSKGIFSGDDIIPIRDLEQMAIQHALDVCDGNVQEAELRLKISAATLYRKKPDAQDKASS